MPDSVKVILDRDSVAMGDDVDSHREFWVLPASATVDDLLVEVSAHYLRVLPGRPDGAYTATPMKKPAVGCSR